MAKQQSPTRTNILRQEISYPDAKRLLEKDIAECSDAGQAGARMFAMMQLAVTEMDLGNIKEADALYTDSVAYILKYGSEEQKGLAFFIKARLCSYRAEFDEGLSAGLRALRYFLPTDNYKYLAISYVICGIMCRRMGIYDESLAYMNKAVDAARKTNVPGFVSMCMQNMNEVKADLTSPEESIKSYLEFIKYLHGTYQGKVSHSEANAYFCISDLYLLVNDLPKARETFGRAEMIKKELNTNSRRIDYLVRNAQIFAAEGKEKEMMDQTKLVLEIARNETIVLPLLQLHSACFDFYMQRGRAEEALKHIKAKIKLLDGNVETLVTQHIAPMYIAYYQATGDTEKEIKYRRIYHEYELKKLRQVSQVRLKHASAIHELELKEKENEMIKKELNLKSQELNMANHFLQQRNELLNDLKESINSLKHENSKREVVFQTLFHKIDVAFNKEDTEKEVFRTKFDSANSDFIRSLSLAYPGLSPAECRICALLRSGFANKEIATLLSTTIRNIETHRLNIRKKLKLKRSDNLQILLSNIK